MFGMPSRGSTPRNGSAVCLDCPQGKFLNSTGAVAMEVCYNRSAGRFGSSSGMLVHAMAQRTLSKSRRPECMYRV